MDCKEATKYEDGEDVEEFRDEYDPFRERSVKRPTTNLETLVNFVKGYLGTGILAMPKAFSNAGYVVAVIGMPLISLITVYTKHMLLHSTHELCKKKRVSSFTLKESVAAACSCDVTIGQMVDWVVFINQIGVGVAFHVFIADNIKTVCDEYIGEYDIRIYVAIVYIPLVLINLLPDLKILAPFSLVANLLSFACFGIILYYVFSTISTLEDKNMAGDAANFPLFLCTAVFSVEGVQMILPMQNAMKNPQDFVGLFGIFNQGMLFVVALYIMMGFFGYMAYGNTIGDSITLSLPKTILAECVRVVYSVVIIISYPIQMYIAIDILGNGYLSKYFKGYSHRLLAESMVRTALVTLTLILGIAIRNLELIISLMGAFSFSLLGLVLPPIVELLLYWHQLKGYSFYLVIAKNIFLICFGLVICVIGTYTSLLNIIESF